MLCINGGTGWGGLRAGPNFEIAKTTYENQNWKGIWYYINYRFLHLFSVSSICLLWQDNYSYLLKISTKMKYDHVPSAFFCLILSDPTFQAKSRKCVPNLHNAINRRNISDVIGGVCIIRNGRDSRPIHITIGMCYCLLMFAMIDVATIHLKYRMWVDHIFDKFNNYWNP
jgi:hypothetical protein